MSKLEGFEGLSDALQELGAQAGGPVLRSAVMSASLPALRAIQAAAPRGSKVHRTYKGRLVAPGFLSRNIRRKSMLHTDKSRAIVLIGPAQEAFYAEFLEHGTRFMRAQPFIEQQFSSQQGAMLSRLKERLRIGIDKAKAKGNRR